jgi:hypothetical protein
MVPHVRNARQVRSSLIPALQDLLFQVESNPDVIRVKGAAGQVLVYEGHTSPGVFLVLTGSVVVNHRASPRTARPMRRDAQQGIFVVPTPSEMTADARGTVVVDHPTEMIFVPRSVVVGLAQMQQWLSDPHLGTVHLV